MGRSYYGRLRPGIAATDKWRTIGLPSTLIALVFSRLPATLERPGSKSRGNEADLKKLSTRVGVMVVLLSGASSAQTTTRVSRTWTGAPGTDHSYASSISADGSCVAFTSDANNLHPEDPDYASDVFVYDRQTGTTTLVSKSSTGVKGNGDSFLGVLSADGRYVAFGSRATNLIPGDAGGTFPDIFLHDRQTGATTLVSRSSTGVQGNEWSYLHEISADGRFVAFASDADNLVPFDTNLAQDVFVHDRQNGTTAVVSLSSNADEGNSSSYDPSISADGRSVAFRSYASNLVQNDANGQDDIFVHDRQTGVTELVSRASNGPQGNFGSYEPSISGDGRLVAFTSWADDLVPGDTNHAHDIFLHDRWNGTTVLVSQSSSGVQANRESYEPSISSNGRFVCFWSLAFNLVPNDSNGASIFLRDLQSSTTEMVDRSSSGAIENGYPGTLSAISGEGRFIAFSSNATNLSPDDTGELFDAFVRDRAASLATFCFGDGTGAPCPCGNDGAPGHGCQNSAATGGAILGFAGAASLSEDTLVLTSAGELPSALSIFLQGSVPISPASYGDGLRCVGGALKRLYVKSAAGGVVSAPQGGDPSISSRSAALGNVIPPGASRFYQTYYRDPSGSFCPNPPGNTWNVSSGIEAVWGY